MPIFQTSQPCKEKHQKLVRIAYRLNGGNDELQSWNFIWNLWLWCDISINCALNTFTPPKHILWQIQTIMGHSNGTERAFMMTIMQHWLKRKTCAHSWSKVPRRRTQRWRCSQTDWKQTADRQQCQERTSAYLSQKAPHTQIFIFHFRGASVGGEGKVHLSCPPSRLAFYRASIPLLEQLELFFK